MEPKVLNTRIQNRFDTLSNWKVDGVELLKGEIALVSVTTQQIDEATGNVVSVPAVLMKVGENGSDGKPKAFSALPWLSAKAADVYDWAKSQYAKDIPVNISADGTYTENTLGSWLKQVSANTANLSEISNAVDVDSVSGAITAAINALDSTSSGTGTFVKAVTQAEGVVAVTMGTISEDELPNISASKIIVTPASGTEGQDGYVAAVTVASKFAALDSELSSLKTSVAGGVHFVGTVAEVPTGAVITINGSTSHTATTGDVVIYAAEGTEYIYTGSAWEELGDTTRIGDLELKVNNLDVTDNKVAHQFVTAVSQEDGKITVSREQPVAEDILYAAGNTDTIKKKIDDNAANISKNTAKLADIAEESTVGAAIAAAINALDVDEPATSGNTFDYAFIATIKQEDGKVVATKKVIPDATTTTKGVATLGASGGAATYESVDTLNTNVSAVESNYMRIGDDDNLYAGKNGTEVIIFNCGDASSWMTE